MIFIAVMLIRAMETAADGSQGIAISRRRAVVGRTLFQLRFSAWLVLISVTWTLWPLFAPYAFGVTFSYSSTSGRIYVMGPGETTLSEIKAALPDTPLCLVDPTNHVWFLGANLVLSDGASLQLHGSAAAGDVDELRLKSDNSSGDKSCVTVDADWGRLDLRNVRVISWDELSVAPDTEYTNFARAFLRARSRLVGTNVQQSTLNVVNSEIGWLGVNASDRFALTWQVVGSAPGVTVFGTVSNSYIHDCQLGAASWFTNQTYGNTVRWSGNVIATNTLFGFDPTDSGQRAVLAANNIFSNAYAPIFRWAGSTQRIYVTGQGEATLSDIANALPTAPLTLVDPTNLIWQLGANLYVINGTHLKLHGPAIGGDVAELRLKSDHPAGTNDIVELRADPGWLDIQNTRITSWNDAVNGPDIITNIYTQARSYIHARSTLDPDGHTAHEARMDVVDSDIGYLGYHATEAYGLAWKVVDTTAKYIPTNSTNSLYDLVKVRGNIFNSHLHGNCFGMYSYGEYGGIWTNNEVDHNLAYGFDPHNYSDYLDIEDNNVHDNGWHGLIASIGCQHGVLRNNRSYNNGLDLSQGRGNGIMLHRSCNNWLVVSNRSYGNRDSGIAIFASNNGIISNNICASNGNAGIRLSVGSRSNLISGNLFLACGGNGIYLFTGTNAPAPDEPTVRCQGNVFTNNLINGTGLSGTNREAIKVENGDRNLFVANVIIETNLVTSGTNGLGTDTTLRFAGTNNLVVGDTLPAGTLAILNTVTNSGHTSVTFMNQPDFTLQLDSRSTATYTNQNDAVYACDQVNVTTTVRPTGAFLTLTSSRVGAGTNTVVTRNFFAVPTTSSAQITVITWNPGGGDYKVWTVQGSSSSMSINYRVGDLLPGVNYTVTRSSVPIATATADAQGYIAFTSGPGTTSTVTYTVNPN